MRMLKKCLSLVLAVLITTTTIPVVGSVAAATPTAATTEVPPSGGSNNGTISPYTVDDYQYTVIEDGIVIVNSGAGTTESSETLEIPSEIDDMPVIGVASLGSQWTVKHVILPDSVQFIGDYMIESLYSLETITFGSGISNLRADMFNYAYDLQEITVSEDNTDFCSVDGVLYNKDKTAVIAYPISKGLSYAVPDSVTNIEALSAPIYDDLDISFSDTHTLFTTVDGVTYNKEKTVVMFCSTQKKGSYTMPDTVTSIQPYAFSGCDMLTEVTVSSKVTEIVYATFASCTNLASIALPGGLVSIDEYAFERSTSLTSIDLPATLESIGSYAFYESGLTSLTVPDAVKTIDDFAFADSAVATLDLGRGIKTIGSFAFAYTPVTAVALPDSLTALGDDAFSGCHELSTLTIGSGLSVISDYAFTFTGVKSVNIPGTVKRIGVGAFDNTALATLTLNEGTVYIDENAFSNCVNLAAVAIPSSVQAIGTCVLANCDSLKTLTVADNNPVYHGEGNCLIVTKEKLLHTGCGGSVIPADGSVTAIGNFAFYDSDNLNEIVIPYGVMRIDDYAFYNSDSIKSIVLPDSVQVLGNGVFSACDSLASASLGNGIKQTGEFVFAYCPLNTVDLGRAITTITPFSFASTDLRTVLFPNSVTTIMYSSFLSCSELTSIELPLSVESIEARAFAYCESLTDVYYEGTADDRDNMEINEDGNAYLLNATWHYGHTNAMWDPVDPSVCAHVYDDTCDTTCNLCFSVRSTSHTITAWTVTKEPTTDTGGEKTGTCDVCGQAFTVMTGKVVTEIKQENIEGLDEVTIEPVGDTNIDENVVFVANEVLDALSEKELKTVTTAIETLQEAVEDHVVAAVFDLKLILRETTTSGESVAETELELDGKVKVTVPVPAELTAKFTDLKLIHIKDDGTVEIVPFSMEDGKATFEATGFSYYTFVGTERPRGDVNGDGVINSTDARLTLQYAVKKIDQTKLNTATADVDGSGEVNSTDARLILQYAVKKIDKFPTAR